MLGTEKVEYNEQMNNGEKIIKKQNIRVGIDDWRWGAGKIRKEICVVLTDDLSID